MGAGRNRGENVAWVASPVRGDRVIIKGMSEMPFFTLLRVWIATAWADDVIVPEEESALREFINLAPLDAGQRASARSWLEEKITLDGLELSTLSLSARTNLYRSVTRIAALDRRITVPERSFLVMLRKRLNIDAATAEKIETVTFGQHRAVEQLVK